MTRMWSAPSVNLPTRCCRAVSDLLRFQLLATHLAMRSLEVAEAAPGEAAYTDGHAIFVTAGGSLDDHRREVIVQATLLGVGSLDPRFVTVLRGRRALARRYLALEGRRVLGADTPLSTCAEDSLDMARSHSAIADPPRWFGTIRPSRLLRKPRDPGATVTDQDIHQELDESEEGSEESKILKLFHNPVLNSTLLS